MKKQIPSLNGLRALSILLVLIAHVQIMNFHLPNGPGGQIGVNIFFIISGFLITYLLLKEENATHNISLKDFYIRRSLRIFPVFYFMLFVYFILQLFGILHIGLSSWLSSLTYTKFFFAKKQDDWETGHFWSLSVEENFYLIWPFVFAYLKKYRAFFAFAIFLIVPFVRLYTDVSVMHLFTRADALMAGCILALYYNRVIKFVLTKPLIVLLTPFATLMFCLLSKKIFLGYHTNFMNHFILAFLGSFGTLTNLSMVVIIVISINFTDNLYFKFLNSRLLNYIGKLSYSLYLWQALFFSRHMGFLAHFPVNMLFIALIALLSYNLIEKPFLKLKDKFTAKIAGRRANDNSIQTPALTT